MASMHLPPVHRSWVHASHTATRAASRSPTPPPPAQDQREEILTAEQGVNSRLAVDLQEAEFLAHANRGDHLPSRGAHADRARMMRNMYGYAPIGSVYDAQELSSEEEKWEMKKGKVSNYGKRHFVKFGNTRTQQELENSIEESEAQQLPPADDSDMSDAEGGPGVFVGGHTGHAAANLAAMRRAQGGGAVNTRQNNVDGTVAQNQRGAPEEPSEMPQLAVAQEESFEQRDMDADVEDLDAE